MTGLQSGWLISFILLGMASDPARSACESGRVKVQMLGTGGPELSGDRASSSYLIWLDDRARVLVDTGPGSAQRFKQTGARFEDVELILFTHFHVDHSADFPTYIKGSYFTERTQTLRVVGPSGNALLPSATEFVKRMLGSKIGVYPYLSDYLTPSDRSTYTIKTTVIPWSYQNLQIRTVYQTTDFLVKSVPVHHGPLPALGYRIEAAGCVVSFTGDMSGRLGQMPKLAKGSDILVAHHAIPEGASGAAANLHMKPSYIGAMAATAGARQLVLSHLMNRTLNRQDETFRIIRKQYAGPVSFPDDIDVIRP